ncbi:MAG: sensor histidine kinase [Ileibacterium sp.]|nr:sensor histidine kinase [Ileibacterium sp.]
MSDYRKMQLILCSLVTVNFAAVLLHAGNMVTASHYVAANNLSRQFLLNAQVVPQNSWTMLWVAVGSFAALAAVLLCVNRSSRPNLYYFLSLAACLICVLCIYGSYTGLFLLLICFLLPREGTWTKAMVHIVPCILLYILMQYGIMTGIFKVPNPAAFVQVYPWEIQSLLNVLMTFLQNLNILLFISYIIVFLKDQHEKNVEVERELEMVSAVNAELKNYAAITEKIGEDKERKRLAREIHDTLGHALTGIAAGIDACIALSDRQPQQVKKQLTVLSRVVRQGIDDVRNSLNKLRPGALETDSFRHALEKMIQEFMDVSSLKINFDYRLSDYDFDITKEDSLFRIIQESITNALRHGHASEIWISMYSDEDRIIISIRDNGCGCEEVHVGFGLRQMQERVNMMGGVVFFDGTQGFMTIINLPVQQGEQT